MEVRFSKKFAKQYKKSDRKIQSTFDAHLHGHPLKGKVQGLRSINITGDWRALYSERMEKGKMIVIFELLGTHSQLYK